MAITQTKLPPARRKPGPQPRGRNVYPLTIAITPAQRTLLDVIAEREQVTISAVVRRLLTAALATEE